MFCSRCGQELSEEARFCNRCGAACSNAAERITTEQDQAATTQHAESFAAVLDSARNSSRRRMPIVVLVAFVTMLIAGAAWAAWTIYTEVTAPQADEQQEAIESPAPEQEADANEPAEEAAPAAAGEPEHVLQVAEILAMDPADVPAFLESQGLVREDKSSSFISFTAESGDAWACPTDNAAPFDFAKSSGAPIHLQTQGGRMMAVSFGTENSNPPSRFDFYGDVPGYDMAESDFASGKPATDIFLSNVPVDLMDNAKIDAFLAACNLPPTEASYGVQDTTEPNAISKIYTGTVSVRNEPHYWYLVQYGKYGVSGPAESCLGCFPASKASQLIGNAALYTEQDWAQADRNMQALIVGQSILQWVYGANGDYRINVKNGQIEALSPFPDKDSETQKFVNKEVFAEINGDELARAKFESLTALPSIEVIDQ